jgi:hypothetical protein
MLKASASLALAAALSLALAGPAGAGKRDKRDPTFQLRSSFSSSVIRYPGDQAFEGGTVRFHGPEKGPYVERCTWTFNNPLYDVLNPTMRCVRYTLENTPQ